MCRAIATGLFCIALASPILAQSSSGSTVGRVKTATLTIRTGPSEQMPACGVLEKDDEVIVHHVEGNDWLAIQPPRGSLSWISQLNIVIQRPPNEPANRFPADAVVETQDNGEVKLAMGTIGDTKPLNVQRTKIPAGTIVRVVGPKITVNSDDGETGWYPIVPPRNDFRYVPKSAIELTGQTERGSFVVRNIQLTEPELGPASIRNPNTGSGSGTGTDPNWPNHALWRDAERYRMDGNYTKAEEVYFQLAKLANQSGDVKLANLCYERVHLVRELAKNPSTPSTPQPAGNHWRANENRKPSATLTPPEPARGSQLVGDGILRRVNFQYSNQKVYALTTQTGAIRYYVLLNGLDIDRHVGRWVELSGTVTYPREFGGDALLSATRFETVR